MGCRWVGRLVVKARDQVFPAVSIGLPVFNAEAYIQRAIDSLQRQTFQNFELFVSDNCSTDATRRLCEALAAADSRVSYHRNDRDLGAAANFNRVVQLARAELFAWSNHNDVWGETYLERCVEALSRQPAVMLAYTRSAKIEAEGEINVPMMSDLALVNKSPVARLRRFRDIGRQIDKRKSWGEGGIEGIWVPVYGVMRTNLLRRTGLIGADISSDTILLGESLMLGSFHEVEETLFFKRDHPERSMRACVAYNKRIAWFTGRGAAAFIFPRWRLFWKRLKAARRVPLSFGSRLRCLAEMLAYYIRRPHEGKALVKELLVNAGHLVKRARRALEMVNSAVADGDWRARPSFRRNAP